MKKELLLYIKDGLSLKMKISHIHSYFTVTKYLWNNDIVEYVDNWTRPISLVIIYLICQN